MNTDAPSPNFELPAPQSSGEANTVESNHEKTTSKLETAPIPSAPPSQPVLPPPPHPIFNLSQKPVSTNSQSSSASSQLQAEDTDLIEKEWVQKAKEILQATKNDPHTQNRELSKIKADYLKKRYNKDIKVEES